MRSELILVDRPERDWLFQPGDTCVLNSGSPLFMVEAVTADRLRTVSWIDDEGDRQEASFPSICLRPHFMTRILMNA